jgi:hypothetical protein
MQTATSQQLQQDGKSVAAAIKQAQNFPPIETETRSHIETAAAAFYLTRKPQTMRAWACLENGPIRPTRINGRLAWALADIKRLLSGGQS